MTLAGAVPEAVRLLDAAEHRAVLLRALGGVAVALRIGSESPFQREPQDLDFATHRRHRGAVEQLLVDEGYAADQEFNVQAGHRRLLFHDPARNRQVDVFIDSFDMCHVIPMGDRLTVEPRTLPMAELLLTKLQIVELNDKDIGDACALLLAAEVAPDDGWAQISATRVAQMCAGDWGLWRTVDMSLDRVVSRLTALGLTVEQTGRVEGNVGALRAAMDAAPKTVRWRARARVGDRVRWYGQPEEVG
jgi:hypothetical protein